MKLEALRQEDDSEDRLKFLKKSKQIEEENFFLEEDLPKPGDPDGFEDVNMDEQGEILEAR